MAYVATHDAHYPHLTVRETIDFALNCFDAGFPGGEPPPDLARFLDNRTKADLVLEMMGLTKVADSLVGSAEVRGISGSEAHLLTLAEMTCGGLSLLTLDEPTKDMDSTDTLGFLLRMQKFARELDFCCIASFNSASKEVFDLFDDVLVLASGRMTYFGPASKAEAYFFGLGYTKPPDMSVPDFLLQVVLDNGSQFCRGAEDRKQRSPAEFAAVFKESTAFIEVKNEIAKLHKGKSPAGPAIPSHALSLPAQFMACFRRQMIVHMRAWENWVVRSLVIIFLGFMAGTLFWRMEHNFSGVMNRVGLIFFVLTIVSGTSWSKNPELFLQRPVLYKQTAAGMFHPAAYLCAITASDCLIRIPGSFIFTSLFYWLGGFSAKDHSGKFWYAVLLCYWVEMCSDALVRFIALCCKTIEFGQFFSGATLVYVCFSAGFLVIKDNIINPWKWMYWINPGRFYFDGFVGSELSKTDWCRDEQFPEWCQFNSTKDGTHTTSGALAASIAVDVHDIRRGIRWLDLGVVWAFWWLYIALGCLVISILRWDYSRPNNAATRELRVGPAPKSAAAARAPRDHADDPKVFHSFQRAFLSFVDVGFSAPVPSRLPFTSTTKPLRVLSGVSGYAKPGTVTAIMGPAGCGKSTFFDVLASHKTVGMMKGTVRINGADMGRFVRRVVAYAEQSLESQAPLQTVAEAIETSAALRLPSEVTAGERREIVLRTIHLMGLVPYAGDIIGGMDDKGLPLDIRRRLAIAVEVASCLPIILVDSPLAGLDPHAAAEIMTALRLVADTGRTVLLTLEDPHAFALACVDNVILLDKKGQQVYFGAPGGVGLVLPPVRDVPAGATTAHLLELAREELETGSQMDAVWHNSGARKALLEGIDSGTFLPEGLVAPMFKSECAASYFTQCRVLLSRHTTMFYRNPWYNVPRMIYALLAGFCLGTYTYDIPVDQSGLFPRLGLFFNTSIVGIPFIVAAANPLLIMRTTYYRESKAGMYGPHAYNMAITLPELPYFLCQMIIFFIQYYFYCGLIANVGRVFFSLFTLLVFSWFLLTNGQLMGLSGSNVIWVNQMAPAGGLIMAISAGFIIKQKSIPGYWRWLYWMNPVHYFLEASLTNELHGIKYPCASPYYCLPFEFPMGDDFLRYQSWDWDHKWRGFYIVLAFAVVFSFLKGIVVGKATATQIIKR